MSLSLVCRRGWLCVFFCQVARSPAPVLKWPYLRHFPDFVVPSRNGGRVMTLQIAIRSGGQGGLSKKRDVKTNQLKPISIRALHQGVARGGAGGLCRWGRVWGWRQAAAECN